MDYSTRVLGRTIATALQEQARAPLLQIGSDRFDKAALASVSCFNFLAAKNLSKHLNQHLKVKNTRDVFERIHPQQLVIPQLGPVSLAVLGAAFEAKGLGGGESPLEAWVRHHDPDQKIVTFASLKQRDAVERQRAAQEKKQRTAARRDRAHAIRVDRFQERTERPV